ncbi:MAG TPA: hypothetical protein DET40_22885 [Lentisphaeria bacterium]|nr:MAG: hypothetical protein A2X45_15900 [Lentisphaerae bacterium GWF2_50_93]HCE46400.1 hypothetical protein [Lentisphaeria bacterium]
MQVIIFTAGILLGFFIPGYLVSVLLDSRFRLLSTFIVSMIILYYCVFILVISGIGISFASVAISLVFVSAPLMFAARRKLNAPARIPEVLKRPLKIEGDRFILRLTVTAIAAALVLFIARSVIQPCITGDTVFRWNFLAMKIFEKGNLDFYPPLKPEDFKTYFYVDGIPPLVSISYYWLYECFNSTSLVLKGLLVSFQFLLIILCAFRLSQAMGFSRNASYAALMILVSSPLFFFSVYVGQETGITALSICATAYFIYSMKDGNDTGAIVLAAFAAALGAISREYGCAFVVLGAILCLSRKAGMRNVIVFIVISSSLSAPWYIRNWILTGNPFYSNSFFNLFPVNPVHTGIMESYADIVGVGAGTLSKSLYFLKLVLITCALPFVLGIAAVILNFRRFNVLAAICLAIFMIWIYSAGKTSGGMFYSMRVLSPMIVLLAIFGGSLISLLKTEKAVRIAFVGLFGICMFSMWLNLLTPYSPFKLPVQKWKDAAFGELGEDDTVMLAEKIPRGIKVVTDSAYFHYRLDQSGIKDVQLIPVWSPEVSFIFEKDMDFATANERLKAAGIQYVLYFESINNYYLEKNQFFREYKKYSKPVIPNFLYKLP